jgi:hypothetical protein
MRARTRRAIIPFNWNYYISGNTNMYGIHDYITICTAVL